MATPNRQDVLNLLQERKDLWPKLRLEILLMIQQLNN